MKLNDKLIKRAGQLEDKAEGTQSNLNRKQRRLLEAVQAKLEK